MKDNKILVSILVPVYNTSSFLNKCLDSLINQTLSNIEIVCVNDGSTDDSLSILQDYAKEDKRVIIVDKKNGGLPSARNAGIDIAKGEYVGFVDSDDYVELNMFEKMYNKAKSQKSEVVVCGAVPFPSDPAPTAWIQETLSPRDVYFEKFTVDALFYEKGARPFLWRNLVKLDLLNRNKIRLNEKIVIGEDQAFQFRIYPKARGISFMSDKLYHYCWWRPGSIMNSGVYTKLYDRVYAHVKLVEHILDEWNISGELLVMNKEFLSWSVDFLYGDFIKLALSERIKVAKIISEIWNKANFWEYLNSFPAYMNEMFEYFYFIAKQEEKTSTKISIIVNLYNSVDYFDEFKNGIISQFDISYEVIFINNACYDGTYTKLHKWLMSDPNIRVINQDYTTIAQTFNQGLNVAVGEYVMFADSHDYVAGQVVLSEYVQKLESEKSDAACSKMLFEGECTKKNINHYKLYDFIFSRQFLLANKIIFEEYARITTRLFVTKAIAKATKISVVENPLALIHSRPLWKFDWIYTEETIKILEGYLEFIKETKRVGLIEEHRLIIDELNSDETVQLILNSTKPYIMPHDACPNGENSQSKAWSLLLQINAEIDSKCLRPFQKSTLIVLNKFVDLRHKFIDGRY